MVLGPGWGSDSIGGGGSDVNVLPDGSHVMGAYDETNILKGNDDAVHTLFKSSDTASETQAINIAFRDYADTTPVAVLTATNAVSSNTLRLGGGVVGMDAPTSIITYARLSTPGPGSIKSWTTFNGVNVGTSPSTPVFGRALQATTTAQANALVVEDGTGSTRSYFDGTNAAPNYSMGLAHDWRAYHDGGSGTVLYNATSAYYLWQAANADLLLKCGHVSGGDILVQTRGSAERARFNGEAGINLADAAIGSITESGQLAGETGTDNLVWVSPQGNKFRIDKTAA